MLKRILCILLSNLVQVMACMASETPCVMVHSAPDHSLLLSLVSHTTINVQRLPPRKAGCACCQHGVPHAHVTVKKVQSRQNARPLPSLKRWTNLHQAIHMVEKWTKILVQTFPEHKDAFVTNRKNLTEALTHMQAKWHASSQQPLHLKGDICATISSDGSHIQPTTSGYLEAVEALLAAYQKEAAHVNAGNAHAPSA